MGGGVCSSGVLSGRDAGASHSDGASVARIGGGSQPSRLRTAGVEFCYSTHYYWAKRIASRECFFWRVWFGPFVAFLHPLVGIMRLNYETCIVGEKCVLAPYRTWPRAASIQLCLEGSSH